MNGGRIFGLGLSVFKVEQDVDLEMIEKFNIQYRFDMCWLFYKYMIKEFMMELMNFYF